MDKFDYFNQQITLTDAYCYVFCFSLYHKKGNHILLTDLLHSSPNFRLPIVLPFKGLMDKHKHKYFIILNYEDV
jgi:hypothetical protein